MKNRLKMCLSKSMQKYPTKYPFLQGSGSKPEVPGPPEGLQKDFWSSTDQHVGWLKEKKKKHIFTSYGFYCFIFNEESIFTFRPERGSRATKVSETLLKTPLCIIQWLLPLMCCGVSHLALVTSRTFRFRFSLFRLCCTLRRQLCHHRRTTYRPECATCGSVPAALIVVAVGFSRLPFTIWYSSLLSFACLRK